LSDPDKSGKDFGGNVLLGRKGVLLFNLRELIRRGMQTGQFLTAWNQGDKEVSAEEIG